MTGKKSLKASATGQATPQAVEGAKTSALPGVSLGSLSRQILKTYKCPLNFLEDCVHCWVRGSSLRLAECQTL